MKKIKQWYIDMISEIPEMAFLEMNKQIITSVCIYIILLVFTLFTKAWMFVLLLTIMYLLYISLLLYKMHLFKAKEIVEINGTCTLIDKDSFPYNRNFILVSTKTDAYKVILTKKYNITVGSEVLLYATKSNVTKMEAYTQINNHLMMFITKMATKM